MTPGIPDTENEAWTERDIVPSTRLWIRRWRGTAQRWF